MLGNAWGCLGMLEYASGCFRMLQDAWVCLRMLEDAWGCLGMLGMEVIWGSFLDALGVTWRSKCDLVASWSQRGWGKEKIDFLWAGSQFVRAPPISLQSGEPRTLKHCKNTYKMTGNFRSGARYRFYRPLMNRQDPYRINLFGEWSDSDGGLGSDSWKL